MDNWEAFIPTFNHGCRLRKSVYSVGFTLETENPCVLQHGDSVVCQVDRHTTNAVQKIMRICMALEVTDPEGL